MASIIPVAAVDQHIAMLGKTGAGKSHAAQGVAEWLIARKRRVCIVDPTDRNWGLRLCPDGKTASGFEPVIFGGQHGDLPLSATHGTALAEIVGTTTTPVIIATRLMTVGERTRFFAEFAEQLLRKTEGPGARARGHRRGDRIRAQHPRRLSLAPAHTRADRPARRRLARRRYAI